MKIQKIGEPRVIMSNPYSPHNYFGWPTLGRLKDGRLAVVASGFRVKHICPFGKTVIAFSDDEGESYTLPAPLIDTPLDDRDGGILAFGESGVLVTSMNNTRSLQASPKSLDHIYGMDPDPKLAERKKAYALSYLEVVTDEQEEEFLGSSFRVSFDNGRTFGPIYKSPVTSPHGPLETRDGRIIWVGRTFDGGVGKRTPETDYVCAYSIEPETGKMEYLGRIENIEEDIDAVFCEPHAIELPDGRLLCHIRYERSRRSPYGRIFTIYQSISEDGGRTWTRPEPLMGPLGGAPAHLMIHSSGTIISAYCDREEPFTILMMFSRDGGATWDQGHVLYTNGVNLDLGYPSTVESPDGSLLTVFYAHESESEPAVLLQQRWRLEE